MGHMGEHTPSISIVIKAASSSNAPELVSVLMAIGAGEHVARIHELGDRKHYGRDREGTTTRLQSLSSRGGTLWTCIRS